MAGLIKKCFVFLSPLVIAGYSCLETVTHAVFIPSQFELCDHCSSAGTPTEQLAQLAASLRRPESGVAGLPGRPGLPGPQGKPGDNGFPGHAGARGLPGLKGPPGSLGKKGQKGNGGRPWQVSLLGGLGGGASGGRYSHNDAREHSSTCIIALQVKWETKAPEGPQHGGRKVNQDRLDFLVSWTISQVIRNKWTLWLKRQSVTVQIRLHPSLPWSRHWTLNCS